MQNVLLKGNLRDLANGGFSYGDEGCGYGFGSGFGHYGSGFGYYGDGSGDGYGDGDGHYGNLENHEDAEYVIEG